MSDTTQLVVIGVAGYVLLRAMSKRSSAYTATTRAAVAKRQEAAFVGANVAAGLSWAVSPSGQQTLGRAASAITGWFSPSSAATPALDWGVGTGFGDDSTSGASFDYSGADGVWD